MRKYLLFYFFVLSLFCITTTINAQIDIDGLMFDWDETMRLDVEPNNTQGRSLFFSEGDPYSPSILYENSDPNYKVHLDVGPVYTHDDADNLYIRVTMNPLADVSAIASDTTIHSGATFFVFLTLDPDSNVVDTTTGTRGDSTGLRYGAVWASGYEMFAQIFPVDSAAEANTDGQQYIWQHSLAPGAEWGWGTMQESVADTTVGIYVAWNAENNEVECAIPKSILANPKYLTPPSMQEGDSIGIFFHFQENASPWWANFICNSTAGWSTGSAYGLIYEWKETYSGAVSVEDNEILPGNYSLLQNYPNPFNPTTSIEYYLPKSEFVTLRVTNMLGQEISTLVNATQNAGKHSVNFNAENLTSGIYFYTIEAGSFSQTNKMMIVK
ncbi:MAG: T9SS type A sorting domain-containing protein [Ignavibacteriaceae bacterium]